MTSGNSTRPFNWARALGRDEPDDDYDDWREDSSVADHQSDGGEATKKDYATPVATSKAPVPKKISVNLDREDQLIYDMKRQGIKDEAIADHLRNEGLTDYKTSSIASRYSRILKCIAAQNEEMYDYGLIDWHDGEDDLLMEACRKADQRIAHEIEELQRKKFGLVAKEINATYAYPRFTAKACQERYEALQDGTARPPLELDDDPEARRAENVERQARYEHAKELEATRKLKDAADKKMQHLEAAQARVEERQTKNMSAEARRMEEQEDRAQRQQLRKQASLQLQSIISEYHAEEQEKRRVRAQERSLLQTLKKRRSDVEHAEAETTALRRAEERKQAASSLTHSGRTADLSKSLTMFVDDVDEDDEELRLAPAANSRIPQNPGTSHLPNTALFRPPKRSFSAVVSGSVTPEDATQGGRQIKRRAPLTMPSSMYRGHITIPDDPGTDPRTIMSKNELMALVTERGMSKNREKETKDLLARRLRDADRIATVAQLQGYLRRRGQSLKGNRADLVWRLVEFDAKHSKEWRPRHMALLQRGRDAIKDGFSSKVGLGIGNNPAGLGRGNAMGGGRQGQGLAHGYGQGQFGHVPGGPARPLIHGAMAGAAGAAGAPMQAPTAVMWRPSTTSQSPAAEQHNSQDTTMKQEPEEEMDMGMSRGSEDPVLEQD